MSGRWRWSVLVLSVASLLAGAVGARSEPPELPARTQDVQQERVRQGSERGLVSSRAPGFVFDGNPFDLIEFVKPHEGGNGRSCATCHRPEDSFGLTPATVEARYQLLQERRRHDPNADDPCSCPLLQIALDILCPIRTH